MDPELRWRLDIVIGLLAVIAVSVVSILFWVGGAQVLLYLGIFSLLLGLLLQSLGVGPFTGEGTRQ
jgi:hypothetical protein